MDLKNLTELSLDEMIKKDRIKKGPKALNPKRRPNPRGPKKPFRKQPIRKSGRGRGRNSRPLPFRERRDSYDDRRYNGPRHRPQNGRYRGAPRRHNGPPRRPPRDLSPRRIPDTNRSPSPLPPVRRKNPVDLRKRLEKSKRIEENKRIEETKKQRPPLAKLFVNNLPTKVENSELNDLFSEYGYLTKCKLIYDDFGRPKGRAVVVYESKEDAERAIHALDGNELDGKVISVELAPSKKGRNDRNRGGSRERGEDRNRR